MFGQSLLSAFGSAACTTDTDQLFTTDVQTTSLATYQLNNATTSIPSNTYPGTASNITYAAGEFGNAAVFNGSNSSILATSPTQGNTDASYSFWIKTPTILSYNNTNPNYPVFGQVSDALRNPFSIYWYASTTSGKMAFTIWRCFNNQIWYATGYFTDFEFTYVANTWYHIVITYTASDKSCRNYVNGTQIGAAPTLTLLGSNFTIGTQMKLGSYNNNLGVPFNGSLDQIRIFNSVLSQAAVTALYNETTTTATYPYVTTEVANPNSVAYYKMSDATDQLGNYNGTASNVNFNTEGKFGFAGAFNGLATSSTSYIDISSSTTSTNCTVSFWFNTTIKNSSNANILNAGGSSSSNTGFSIRRNSSGFLNIGFTKGAAGNTQTFTGATDITDGIWHNVVLSMASDNTFVFYLDGSSHLSGTRTNFIGSQSQNLSYNRFGTDTGTVGANSFEGSIDQIRIYDSAISAANVTTLYNEIECPAVAVTNAFNTVLYTGNGGTQSVTGTGFKPDLSWVKNRNTAGNNHNLADSIRGVNNVIQSNLTAAQYFNSTYQFNSFDTDGITVTDDAAGNWGFNGNNETYVSWNWKAPLANLSTSFNGSSSYISVPNSAGNNMSTFSVSFWFKTSGQAGTLINNGGADSSQRGWYIAILSTGFLRFTTSTSGNADAYGTTNYADNSWHNVVLIYTAGLSNASPYNIYVDGNSTPEISGTDGRFTTTSTQPLTIGRFARTSIGFFNGSIDQIRIFDTTLSASEVSDLYAEPAASNNTLNYPAGAGCIAAYPLETDAVDLSGNYNGTPSNVTFSQPGYLTQNTEGTITSTVAANVDAGFSILKYTGNGSTAQQSYGHGLSSAPELLMTKNIDTATQGTNSWVVGGTLLGNGGYMFLNGANAKSTASSYNGNKVPDSEVIYTSGTSDLVGNQNGINFITYAFHSVSGYSKVGSYIGTGVTGNAQYIGFEPAFLLVKRTSSTSDWYMIDNKRNPSNPRNSWLNANSNVAEYTPSHGVDFSSNGFSFISTDLNGTGQSWIFLAIA